MVGVFTWFGQTILSKSSLRNAKIDLFGIIEKDEDRLERKLINKCLQRLAILTLKYAIPSAYLIIVNGCPKL